METFIIKLNGYFYVGEQESVGKVNSRPTSGWLSIPRENDEICFSRNRQKAKVLEGNINLNSAWQRIYNAMRYDGLTLNKLEIISLPAR